MWFESLFKYPEAAYQSGKLVFTNVSDPLWWYVGAAVAVLAIVLSVALGMQTRTWRWWQQTTIATLQALVVLGAIGLLAGPGLQTTTLQPGANNIAVLVDNSGSMAFPNTNNADRGGGVSSPGNTKEVPRRLDAALDLLQQQLLPTLAALADIALFSFDTTPLRTDSISGNVTEGNTHLLAATDSVLASFKGMPLAAVVVLSDGADNDEISAIDTGTLASHGVAVHTIGFGPATMPGETQLSDVQIAADAPPRSRVTARLVIEHSSAGEAMLRIRDGGTLLAARKILLPENSPIYRTEIAFDSGSAGIRELSFELEPPAGDNLVENNRIDRLLTVSDRQRRILYLEGEPRWEYKFIRRALEGDDVLDLVSWLRTTDRKTYRQGIDSETELADGFPIDLASLYGFDVVVLGSLAASTLNEEQHRWLESFVSERGGSLLVIAGRESLADGHWDVQPLAAALPVYLDRTSTSSYRSLHGSARPTRAGSLSPMTQLVDAEGGDGWSSLPPLGDLQQLGELKPAATTLLEFVTDETTYPLLVTQPYGLGTTAVLATASTWRWQMRTPPGDSRHSLFWRQLLRQLAESSQQQRSVNLTLDGDGIAIRVWVRDDEYQPAQHVSATAVITHADRSTSSIKLNPSTVPGLLAARYVPGDGGIYRVDVNITDSDGKTRAGGAAGDQTINARNTNTESDTTGAPETGVTETVTRFVRAGVEHKEFFHPTRNDALLRRIADVTGGTYWQGDDISGLAAMLNFASTGIRAVEVLPLWNLPLFFLLLVLLKIGEWSLRRLWGRV